MVFEKSEIWSFEAPSAPELLTAASGFWTQRGYSLQSTSATSFRGRSFHSTLGIHRVLDLVVTPSGTGAVVHLRYRADVRPEVAAGGAVVAVLLLPLAVVGAAISWHEYESDWSRERWDFWNFLVSGVKAQPLAAASSAPLAPSEGSAPPPPPPPPGAVAGAAPASGSPTASACPACGAAATGQGRFCSSCGTAIPARSPPATS